MDPIIHPVRRAVEALKASQAAAKETAAQIAAEREAQAGADSDDAES